MADLSQAQFTKSLLHKVLALSPISGDRRNLSTDYATLFLNMARWPSGLGLRPCIQMDVGSSLGHVKIAFLNQIFKIPPQCSSRSLSSSTTNTTSKYKCQIFFRNISQIFRRKIEQNWCRCFSQDVVMTHGSRGLCQFRRLVSKNA